MAENLRPDAEPEQELFDPQSFSGIRAVGEDGAPGFLGTIRGKPRFFPDDPAADPAANAGAFDAAMINAGELTTSIFDRIDAATGNESALHRVQQREQALQGLSEAHPIASGVGRALPSFVLPGGLASQVIGGGALAALENPEDPGVSALVGGALGAAGKIGGDALGDFIQAKAAVRSSSAARRAKGAAIEAANESGIPLTIANKTDGIVAQFFDRQASTLLGRAVKGPTKQRALNRAFAESIGVPGADALTDNVLGQAAKQYGSVFENVAKQVDEIPLTESFGAGLDGMTELAQDLVPNARALRQLEIVENFALGDLMNGQQYNRLRSQLTKISRAEWKAGGDQVSGEFIDELVGVLDQALVEAAPELAADLVPARTGWRQLIAIRRGAALDPRGNVNPVSMARSLETVYPGLDLGRFSPGAVGKAQRANLASTAFPEFRSSGTAERSIVGNLPGMAVGAAELALGGGAPGQVGGGIARQGVETANALIEWLSPDPAEPESQE